MDDRNDRNSNDYYSDFFKRGQDERDKEKERPVYYTYGPANQQQNDPGAERTVDDVELTAPKPLRPYPLVTSSGYGYPEDGYKAPKPKSTVRSMFAAFMAGALVVSSLMFAADRYNLFTAPGAQAAGIQTVSTQGSERASALGEVVRPNTIAQIARQSSPAIVKIETFATPRRAATNRSQSPFFNDPFFRQFFGDAFGSEPSAPADSTRKQPAGMGTGFIFDKSGYILTNEHVVNGAEEIQVTVQGYQEPLKAKLLGSAYELDLAVLKIESNKEFPTLPFGSSDAINVGDWVVAIGNPYGFDHTVTVGVLSAKERPIDIPDRNGTRHYKHLLQTDASINPGNSGGPLLNLAGEVVGINTAVNATAQGIGFAIPTSTVMNVLQYLKDGKEVPKQPEPYVGIGLSDIDRTWTKELKVDSTDGALITQVYKGTPADRAGLKVYDVVLEAGGKKIQRTAQLIEIIKAAKVGERLNMTVSRDGQKIEVGVIIADKNAQQQP